MKKFLISDYNQLCDMTQYELNYSSAVRAKCKECCGFDYNEVRRCDCKTCALYPAKMRFINRDDNFKKEKKLTDEQKEALRRRMQNIHFSPNQ